MNVICPGCGESYHETNKHYSASRPAHGGMFKLKEIWRDRGWSAFPENDGMAYGALECPGCLTMYCDSAGYIIKMEGVSVNNTGKGKTESKDVAAPDLDKIVVENLICLKCGKEYKRSNHYKNHVSKCDG